MHPASHNEELLMKALMFLALYFMYSRGTVVGITIIFLLIFVMAFHWFLRTDTSPRHFELNNQINEGSNIDPSWLLKDFYGFFNILTAAVRITDYLYRNAPKNNKQTVPLIFLFTLSYGP